MLDYFDSAPPSSVYGFLPYSKTCSWINGCAFLGASLPDQRYRVSPANFTCVSDPNASKLSSSPASASLANASVTSASVTSAYVASASMASASMASAYVASASSVASASAADTMRPMLPPTVYSCPRSSMSDLGE